MATQDDLKILKQKKILPMIGETYFSTIIGSVVGFIVSVLWVVTRSWILNNLLGTILSIVFLKTIKIKKLMPGVVLLGSLFFYDIFFVFISPMFTSGGQSVMVTVATKLDVPIKLVMPRLSPISLPTSSCSILGLGDIVIPGTFIGFMKSFGKYVAKSRVYHDRAIAAYSISLLMCGASLYLFNTA